ncbi:T9SS type A sorting domain-containing protein [Hymenobacter gummosus]|uniref:T9SS type A sorting domain-containing protein n=1 Tax=Hymenobacter gummosus TaxID=1776032 RepID=A0A431U0R3_9BACT|nr:metallophosphoesterase [Hymenobacter gummosus]RTQ48512.1 T9SS type A sorting domain-containing protein [Hymenobacter gummosus]
MPHFFPSLRTAFFGLLAGFSLLTLPAQAQRFAAIGDYGYAGPAERDVAALVKSWNPDFIITLGDNNYDVGDSLTIDQNIGQYYHEYIGNYRGRYGPSASTNRFFPSLGNHDYYTSNGEPYRRYFTLPGNGRYYEFVRGNVHFFALNSDPQEPDGIGSTSRQAQWLRAALAAAPEPWKVVYFHHAPYSSGYHGNTPALQWPFREWGASVVLAGHDHHYERLEQDSLVYIVNGLGGRSIYNVRMQPVPQSRFSFNGDYGALLLQANADSLHLQFFTRRQRLIDSYTLRRAPSPTARLFPVVPNPFDAEATVEFFLPAPTDARLRVLNGLGQEVAVLHQGPTGAGWHRLGWARNGLRPGVYYVQLVSGGTTQVVRVVAL